MIVAVSSFSFVSMLGPVHVHIRGQDGSDEEAVYPVPQTLTMEDFVSSVRPRLGVDAVELCQLHFGDASPERVSGLRRALAEAGVTVTTFVIDVGNLSRGNDAQLASDLHAIERWLDIGQAVGAHFARVNMGDTAEAADEVGFNRLAGALRRVSDACAGRDLRLIIENHGQCASDPDWLIRLQDVVGFDRLGILLDVGNFDPVMEVTRTRFEGGQVNTPVNGTEAVYDKIARLAPRASVVHAKALDPLEDGTPLLDLDRALAIVVASGFQGPVGIEWEGQIGDPWEQTHAAVQLVRRHFPSAA